MKHLLNLRLAVGAGALAATGLIGTGVAFAASSSPSAVPAAHVTAEAADGTTANSTQFDAPGGPNVQSGANIQSGSNLQGGGPDGTAGN